MTKYEAIATAIATLEAIRQFGIDKWIFDKEEIEAFDKAIEALQAKVENCGDLISKSEVIETVGEWSLTEEWGEGKEPPFKLVEMINSIQSAEAEPKTGEWKPVSEELPQRVGSYLVTCIGEHGSVYVDYDYWTVLAEFKYNRDKVTAWMPFPRPYCGAKMGTEGRK